MPILTQAEKDRIEENRIEIVNIESTMTALATRGYVDKSVINTYGGTTPPDVTLGKNDDHFRQYPDHTPTEVFNEPSAEAYAYSAFVCYESGAVTTGVSFLAIAPSRREIEVEFIEADIDMDNMSIKIGGVVVPLTVKASTAHFFSLNYEPASDAVIQGITVGTEIIGTASVLTGQYKDFIKYDGQWIEWQHFSRPTMISAYSATPTEAELITGLKLLPHYEDTPEFWGNDHDFYLRDDPQTKLLLVKYRANGDTTETGTNKIFWFEKLTKAN